MADVDIPGHAGLFYRRRLFERGFAGECATQGRRIFRLAGGETLPPGGAVIGFGLYLDCPRVDHAIPRCQPRSYSASHEGVVDPDLVSRDLHHGGDTCTTRLPFLEKIRIRVILDSGGAGDSYGRRLFCGADSVAELEQLLLGLARDTQPGICLAGCAYRVDAPAADVVGACAWRHVAAGVLWSLSVSDGRFPRRIRHRQKSR